MTNHVEALMALAPEGASVGVARFGRDLNLAQLAEAVGGAWLIVADSGDPDGLTVVAALDQASLDALAGSWVNNPDFGRHPLHGKARLVAAGQEHFTGPESDEILAAVVLELL